MSVNVHTLGCRSVCFAGRSAHGLMTGNSSCFTTCAWFAATFGRVTVRLCSASSHVCCFLPVLLRFPNGTQSEHVQAVQSSSSCNCLSISLSFSLC